MIKTCLLCNKTFKAYHVNLQKFCSRGCSTRYWTIARSGKRKQYFKEYRKEWNEENRDRLRILSNASSRKRLRELKQAVFEKYGNACNSCGFDDWRALQIDHIENDGYKERALVQKRRTYYKFLLEDNSGRYQILCANCNWIKKHDNNENARNYL